MKRVWCISQKTCINRDLLTHL